MKNSEIQAPLARDGQGNSISLPENAAAWRLRRHTGGRPRVVLGLDRQPLRLPLAATVADLDDMLGPGTYRLDAVDDRGNLLGITTAVPLCDNVSETPGPSGISVVEGEVDEDIDVGFYQAKRGWSARHAQGPAAGDGGAGPGGHSPCAVGGGGGARETAAVHGGVQAAHPA